MENLQERELNHLFKREKALIHADFQRELKNVHEINGYFSGALLLFGVAVLFISAGILYYLSQYMSFWQACFLMALLAVSCGGLLYGAAKEKEKKARHAPARALHSLSEIQSKITRH